MLYTLLTLLVVIVTSIVAFKTVTAPKLYKRQDGTTSFTYATIPSSFQFYFRALTSLANFTKPGRLGSKKIPPFEVIVEDGRLDEQKLQKFIKVCKLVSDRYKTEQPLTWNFASLLPLASCIVTHPKFPLRPISTLIHMKQTIDALRPLKNGEKTKKRLIMGGGATTDRGSELDGLVEIYDEKQTLFAAGRSFFLIPGGKRGAKKEETKETKEELPVTKTTTFPISGSSGLQYAAASGDYNPWHLTPTLAKIFGYKKPIAQGYLSVNRCLAEIGDNVPSYPLHFEVEWQKPLFMPSTVKYTERRSADGKKIVFELATEDGQHVHLVGCIQNIPSLQLTRTEKQE